MHPTRRISEALNDSTGFHFDAVAPLGEWDTRQHHVELGPEMLRDGDRDLDAPARDREHQRTHERHARETLGELTAGVGAILEQDRHGLGSSGR